MPEENNNAAGQGADNSAADDAGENKQGAGADNQSVDNAGAGDAGDDKGGAGEGENKDTQKGNDKNAKAPAKSKDTQFDDDGVEPATRKAMSPKDFIIQRQQRKIAKMQQHKAKDDAGGDDEEDDDDEVAPEDEALITKVVAKKFAPIFEKTLAAEDERDIAAFLKENPDFLPFEAKARRFIAHPSRRHLPVESVFYEVAGKHLLKMGAERGKKADEEAKATQTGGGSNRGGDGGKKSDWDMSKEEFEAKQERIRRSRES